MTQLADEQMSKAMAIFNSVVKQDEIADIEKAENAVLSLSPHAITALGAIKGAIVQSRLTAVVRRMVSRCRGDIMQLQGKPYGFLTDKDKEGGYPPEVVEDCCVAATAWGLRWTGNEFNIIAGKMYPAQAGMMRVVREFPGVNDIEIDYGVPMPGKDNTQVVSVLAKWKVGDRPMQIAAEIPIKVNNGMGPDAVLGKAKRKIYARIYERLSGIEVAVVDAEENIPTNTRLNQTAAALPEKAADAPDVNGASLDDALKKNAKQEVLPLGTNLSNPRGKSVL